jgi:hypothetical protein
MRFRAGSISDGYVVVKARFRLTGGGPVGIGLVGIARVGDKLSNEVKRG